MKRRRQYGPLSPRERVRVRGLGFAVWGLVGLLLLLLTGILAAQEPARTPAAPAAPRPAAAPGQAGPAQKKDKDVYLEHADRIRVNNRTHDVEVSGGVILRHEDGRFYADTIRFNTRSKIGSAIGKPRYQDEESQVTGDRVDLNFQERRAAFVGAVTLIHQKKSEAKTAAAPSGVISSGEGGQQPAEPARNPAASAPSAPSEASSTSDDTDRPFTSYQEERTVITCGKLEYLYRDKQAIAEGQVKAVQQDRTAYGDKAVYDQNQETLLVTGNVRVENEAGETFRCDQVLISLRDDWLEAEGNVASHFLVKDEDEEEGKAPAKGEPGAKPAK